MLLIGCHQRPGVGAVAIVRVTKARTKAESSTKDDILQLVGIYSKTGTEVQQQSER